MQDGLHGSKLDLMAVESPVRMSRLDRAFDSIAQEPVKINKRYEYRSENQKLMQAWDRL